MAVQGVGAIVGALTATQGRCAATASSALAGFGHDDLRASAALLMADSALPVVLAGKVLFGLGLPWIVHRRCSRCCSAARRRTCRAARSRRPSSRSARRRRSSIALGAALVALMDYRLVLLVQAVDGRRRGRSALLTRMQRTVAALDRDFYDELVAADGQPRAARAHARRGAGGARPRGADRRPAAAATRSSCSRGSRSTPAGPATDRCATARSRSTSSRGSSPPTSGRRSSAASRSGSARSTTSSTTSTTRARSSTTARCRGSWSCRGPPSPAPRTASARPAASTATSPAATSCATATAPGRCSRTTSARRRGISYVLENRRAMTRLLPGAVRALPRAARRPLPGAAADRAGGGRADRRGGGGDRRRLDAGPVQLRLLRARVPGAPDGRRARRGVRPRRPRRRLPHPHHPRPAARPRDLPPDRRRLHGPARVPAGLACSASRA